MLNKTCLTWKKNLEMLGKNWLFYVRKILNQYIIDCKEILFIKELVLLPVIFINISLLIYSKVFLNEMSSTCLSFIKQKKNSEQKDWRVSVTLPVIKIDINVSIAFNFIIKERQLKVLLSIPVNFRATLLKTDETANLHPTQQYRERSVKKSTAVFNCLKTLPSCPSCWCNTIKTKVKFKNGITQLNNFSLQLN